MNHATNDNDRIWQSFTIFVIITGRQSSVHSYFIEMMQGVKYANETQQMMQPQSIA